MDPDQVIDLFNRMRQERLPQNQVAILLWMYERPNTEQKDMIKPLGMSANVICQAMRILKAEKLVLQTPIDGGGNNRKKHNLTPVGTATVKKILAIDD